MVFADTVFYEKSFLSGRAAIIPLSEFMFWSEEATIKINQRGLSDEELERIVSGASESGLRKLKRCACKVAEAIFIDNEKQFMALNGATSMSVGGFSQSAAANLQQPSKELSAKLKTIIYDDLGLGEFHNDFVFRGV